MSLRLNNKSLERNAAYLIICFCSFTSSITMLPISFLGKCEKDKHLVVEKKSSNIVFVTPISHQLPEQKGYIVHFNETSNVQYLFHCKTLSFIRYTSLQKYLLY